MPPPVFRLPSASLLRVVAALYIVQAGKEEPDASKANVQTIQNEMRKLNGQTPLAAEAELGKPKMEPETLHGQIQPSPASS